MGCNCGGKSRDAGMTAAALIERDELERRINEETAKAADSTYNPKDPAGLGQGVPR